MKFTHLIFADDPDQYTDVDICGILLDNGITDPTDEQTEGEKHEQVQRDFEDEMANLNKVVDGYIVNFATLGLWNGQHEAVKVMGSNLHDILTGHFGYFSIGSDGENIVAVDTHHDGTNYYTFRYLPREKYDEYEDIDWDNTQSLLPMVSAIYGWEN